MFSELAIISVNWNLKNDTLELIKSLLESGVELNQIVIVDNGSTDGSIQVLKNIYQDTLNIIEAKENRGYAAGLNLGITHALINNAQWFLLLNNDTVVSPNFIEELRKASSNEVGYTILTPMILYHDHPSIIWSMGDRCIDHTLLTTRLYKDQQAISDFPSFLPVDFTSGCAMLVHRHVFEKIGLFDESLFMYGEEVDFCWRARQSGFKSAVYPSARMWHKVSMSAGKDQPRARYLKIRNQIFFYERNSKTNEQWFYFVYTFLRSLAICIFDLVRLRIDLARPTLKGWIDGWFQRHAVAAN